MFKLEPTSEEVMVCYREHVQQWCEIADALCNPPYFSKALCPPRFSRNCFIELSQILVSENAAHLVEAFTRIKNYGDAQEYASRRKAVSKLLNARNVRLTRGKRTNPSLQEMVGGLAPVLLYYALPLASGECSVLVKALRLIADELKINGDPRDELRKLNRIKKRHAKFVAEVVSETFIKGFSPTNDTK